MPHTNFFTYDPLNMILPIVSFGEEEKTNMCNRTEREGLPSSRQTVSYEQMMNLGNTIQLC
jgi:hypothetical protein